MSIAIMKKDFYTDSMRNTDGGKKENVALKKAISFFGNAVKLSKLLNHANSTEVSRWLYGTRLIPIKHAIKIEELTQGKIKAKDLRTDIKWLSSLNIKETSK